MKYIVISILLVILFLFIALYPRNDKFGDVSSKQNTQRMQTESSATKPDVYYRGNEKMMVQTCPQNYEQVGAMCYEKCKPGYIGIGEGCWEDCPIGKKNSAYMNNGITCRRYWPMDTKSRKSYYRNSKFVAVKCPTGYNKNGPMCYKKCLPGYTGDKVLCYANKNSWTPYYDEHLYDRNIYYPSRFLA